MTEKRPVDEWIALTDHELAVLDAHRAMLLTEQDPGYAAGWLFPGRPRGRRAGQDPGPMAATTFQRYWRMGCQVSRK